MKDVANASPSPDSSPRGPFLSWATTLAAGILILAVHVVLGGEPGWLLWGAAAWLGGLVLKVVLSATTLLWPSLPVRWKSALEGLLSAVSELGVAAAIILMFARAGLDPVDISGFAAGAAVTELALLGIASLVATPAEDVVDHWQEGAAESFCVRHQFLVERSIALAGHVGSRGLVTLAVLTGSAWPAVVALAGFSATDGLAAYGHAEEWNWMAPAVCRRVFTILAAIAGIEVGLFYLVLW